MVKDRTFWKQLNLIGANDERKNMCALNCLIAEATFSKWINDFQISSNEYENYEDGVISQWEIKRCQILDSLPEHPDDDVKKTAGLNILHTMENNPKYFRYNFTDERIYHGFCHMLSDEKKIGWHPYFKELLGD